MPPETPDVDEGFDDQEGAEALDEDKLDPAEQRGEMRTFEELTDVEDVTQAVGDRDDDEAVALDADEFDEDAVTDADLEEDDELHYRAATAEREDDLDGQGPENASSGDSFNEDRVARGQVEGLDQVEDADQVEGGEDDITDFQKSDVSDADLRAMGYSETRNGETRAKK